MYPNTIAKNPIKFLIHKLLRLYYSIASSLLHTRIRDHLENGNVEHDRRIQRLLSERMDESIALNESDENDSDGNGQEIDSDIEGSDDYSARKYQENRHRSLTGLFNYFSKKRSEAVLDPHLSKRLKKAVWHHIHATLRCSRQGEMEKAKLHAGIMNNALKEAAHYMSKEQYVEFTSEIEKYLYLSKSNENRHINY